MRYEIVPVIEPTTLAEDDMPKDDVEVVDGGTGEPTDAPDRTIEEDPGDDMDEMGNREDFHSMLVLEGVWTGDGRYIEEEALSWRDLPLPMMATNRTTEAHMNAVLIGNITRIERMGREIHGWGGFVKTDDPEVMALQSLVREGELRGVSVDLDAVEYEVLMPDGSGAEMPEMDEEENATVLAVEEMKMRVTGARIMGATVVPFPAFQEAFIESMAAITASLAMRSGLSGYVRVFENFDDIDFSPPQGAREEAQRGLDWRDEFGRGGTAVGIARARDISNGANLSPDTIVRMTSYFARHEVDKQGEGWSPGEDGFPSNGRIAWALWGGDPGRAWSEKVRRQMDARRERGSIVASGHPINAPLLPPSEWFANPGLEGPTGLTVSDEGRVYGHLAVWGQCHIGYTDRCIQPPSSATNYAHFRTGEILCSDGARVAVGQITLKTGHASHSATAQAAADHYDNTGAAVVDVVAGEDEHGIWISGALRPGLAGTQVRELMAAGISGDWRRIGGSLELVAILAVNVPGFSTIRVTELEGLVASISLPAYTEDAPAPTKMVAVDPVVERIASTIGRTREARLQEITQRVKRPAIEGLVRRVKGN